MPTRFDNTKEHEAYKWLQSMCRRTKTKWSDHATTHPDILAMAKAYKREYMREYDARKVENRRISYAHLEKLPWFEIQTGTSKYTMLPLKDRRSGKYEDLKEIRQYYTLINNKDRAKRNQHPDIRPMFLGGDPRVREWPSGRIEYKLYYYEINNKRKYRRSRVK